MRVVKVLKTVEHLTIGRICSRQASVLTILFSKCLLCRRDFWKMGMGGKYASLKEYLAACVSKKLMLSSSGLEADKGKQREKQREREGRDRDRRRERD